MCLFRNAVLSVQLSGAIATKESISLFVTRRINPKFKRDTPPRLCFTYVSHTTTGLSRRSLAFSNPLPIYIYIFICTVSSLARIIYIGRGRGRTRAILEKQKIINTVSNSRCSPAFNRGTIPRGIYSVTSRPLISLPLIGCVACRPVSALLSITTDTAPSITTPWPAKIEIRYADRIRIYLTLRICCRKYGGDLILVIKCYG